MRTAGSTDLAMPHPDRAVSHHSERQLKLNPILVAVAIMRLLARSSLAQIALVQRSPPLPRHLAVGDIPSAARTATGASTRPHKSVQSPTGRHAQRNFARRHTAATVRPTASCPSRESHTDAKIATSTDIRTIPALAQSPNLIRSQNTTTVLRPCLLVHTRRNNAPTRTHQPAPPIRGAYLPAQHPTTTMLTASDLAPPSERSLIVTRPTDAKLLTATLHSLRSILEHSHHTDTSNRTLLHPLCARLWMTHQIPHESHANRTQSPSLGAPERHAASLHRHIKSPDQLRGQYKTRFRKHF